MQDQWIEWVARGLEKPGKTQVGLAAALNIAQPQISRLLDGVRQIKVTEVERIARYLESDPPDYLRRVAPIVGEVRPGATVALLSGKPQPSIPAPPSSGDSTKALRIETDSLGPALKGWLLFFDDDRQPAAAELSDRLVVAALADESAIVVRTLIASRDKGRWHLLGQADPPIMDAEVTWAAPVKALVPP